MIGVAHDTADVHVWVLDSGFVAPLPKRSVTHASSIVGVRVFDSTHQVHELAAEPDQLLTIVRLASSVPLQRLVPMDRETGQVARRRCKEPFTLPLEELIAATEGGLAPQAQCPVPQRGREEGRFGVTDRAHTLGDRRHEPVALVMAAKKPFGASVQKQMLVGPLGVQDMKGGRRRRHDQIEILAVPVVADIETERPHETVLAANDQSCTNRTEVLHEVSAVHIESRSEYTTRARKSTARSIQRNRSTPWNDIDVSACQSRSGRPTVI